MLARSVGVIIGPDELPPEELGLQKKDGTALENFSHFLRAPDEASYRRHCVLASQFLQRFARHNEPDRAHMEVKQVLCKVSLSPVEQVLYIEKDRDLRGLDVFAVLSRGRGTQGGARRNKRLREALCGLDNLSTAEEIRIFQASCIEDAQGKTSEVMARVRQTRLELLEDAIAEFVIKAKDISAKWKEWQRVREKPELKQKKKTNDVFRSFHERSQNGKLQVDMDLSERIKKIIADAVKAPKKDALIWGENKRGKDKTEDHKEGKQLTKEKQLEKKLDDLDISIKLGLNSQHGLNALLNEINSRQKVLRFFDSASGLLEPESLVKCDASGKQLPAGSAVVLPCGHRGCDEAFASRVRHEGRCSVPGCMEQNVTPQDVLHLSAVQEECADGGPAEGQMELSGTGPFGSKFACLASKLATLLKEDVTNRVLLFCQIPDLMKMLQKALDKARVPHRHLSGNATAMHQVMGQFSQATGKEPRVMLVDLDERCSGTNLTAANHVFFAHPVMRSGQRSPADIEAQAVGRALRFGQERPLTVWRFITKGTVEAAMEVQNQMERRA